MTGPSSSTLLLTTLTPAAVAALAVGTATAARRAGFARPWRIGAGVAAGLGAWLAVTAALALTGALAVSPGARPREPLLPPIALGTLVLLSLTRSFRRLLDALPAWQPVAFQTFRVGVEAGLWLLHREGLAPVQVTFEGRNIDGLVGLTAPVVASLIALGWIGPRLAIGWNLFGVAMLGNAIWTSATSAPGPQHLNWPGEPFAAIAAWPVVWIPAFLAPTAMFLHYVSIRQAFGFFRHGSPNGDGTSSGHDPSLVVADPPHDG